MDFRFVNGLDAPLAGWEYILTFEGGEQHDTLPEDGRLRARLPAAIQEYSITFRPPEADTADQQELHVSVQLSEREPTQSNEGAQCILQNLGFYSGPKGRNDVSRA